MTEPAMCAMCGKPADDAALILYGICDGCVQQPINRERTSAVTDAYHDDTYVLRVVADNPEREHEHERERGVFHGEHAEPWYEPFTRCPRDRTFRRWYE